LKPQEVGIPWFDPRLTELTYGRHPDKGQVYIIGAGTGIGKTMWLTKQLAYDLLTLEEQVAGFFLETSAAELYQRIAGLAMDRVYHLPGIKVDKEELWSVVESFSDRFFCYNSFGAADIDVILPLMRYLREAQGVRIFYVDNMSQLTDEARIRESVEDVAKKLKSLADQLRVTILVASHLASPEKGSHEEGGKVSLRHFYGSRKLTAWVDGAFGMERDTQASEEAKHVSTLRVLKLRLAGRNVGKTIQYRYFPELDTIEPHDDSDEVEDFEEDFF
jgi:twinkle protein